MLVHSVLFWLKPGLDDEARESFRSGLESLRGIESVSALYIGTPAATPARPVIDTSYDYALTVLLPDLAAHDVYQDHALHLAFVERCKPLWDRVAIYDAM